MDELIEILAERSHRGWAEEKQRQGYAPHVFRPLVPHGVKSETCYWIDCVLPKEKHHPDMLPYADLPEHVKEYDRVTVRGVLDGIAAAGYVLVKAP